MSVDSIIFFVLALIVWGLSVAARWFQEQMQKQSTDGIEFEPIDWSSGSEREPVPNVQTQETPVPKEQPSPPIIPDRRGMIRQKGMVSRLGLGRPQTVRRGIILMTVLGPCRALEKSDEFMRS